MIKTTNNLKMTDNLYQFRNYILENLIEMGYKYIARDKCGTIYAFSSKPIRRETVWVVDIPPHAVDKLKDISLVSRMFTDVKWEDKKPFEITCVNWDDVPEDTKVIVTGEDGSEWKCHFLKKVSNNSILVYRDGKTSWTSNDVVEVDINNVRLA